MAAAMIPIGVLMWAVGMLGGGAEIVFWLKHGTWSGHSLFWLMEFVPQTTNWAGFDSLIAWLWHQPLWAVVAGSGFTLAILGIIGSS